MHMHQPCCGSNQKHRFKGTILWGWSGCLRDPNCPRSATSALWKPLKDLYTSPAHEAVATQVQQIHNLNNNETLWSLRKKSLQVSKFWWKKTSAILLQELEQTLHILLVWKSHSGVWWITPTNGKMLFVGIDIAQSCWQGHCNDEHCSTKNHPGTTGAGLFLPDQRRVFSSFQLWGWHCGVTEKKGREKKRCFLAKHSDTQEPKMAGGLQTPCGNFDRSQPWAEVE